MKKLPEILFAFWVMKICATTLGETAGDLLSMTMHVGYAASTMILMGIFLVTVVAQLVSKRYTAAHEDLWKRSGTRRHIQGEPMRPRMGFPAPSPETASMPVRRPSSARAPKTTREARVLP